MRYITIGTVSSEKEFQEVIARVEGDRIYQLAELVTTITAAEQKGFAAERKRWDDVPNEGAIKIYSSAGTAAGSIWAAIEVGHDGMTLTLLKIVDRFSGGEREAAELLADALDRRSRSKRP